MTGDPDSPTRIVKRSGCRTSSYSPSSRAKGRLRLHLRRAADAAGSAVDGQSAAGSCFPLSWGGKQAGRDRPRRSALDGGILDRVTAGASISRRGQPRLRSRRRPGAAVRARRARVLGGCCGWAPAPAGSGASFEGPSPINSPRPAPTVVFDTRVDPILARNAVYGRGLVGASALRQRSAPGGGASREATRATRARRTATRSKRAAISASSSRRCSRGRVLREDSDRPLPPYLQPQLGGLSTLRGFRTGSFVGDTGGGDVGGAGLTIAIRRCAVSSSRVRLENKGPKGRYPTIAGRLRIVWSRVAMPRGGFWLSK